METTATSENANESNIPMMADSQRDLGVIQVNNSVVAQIVRIATLGVPGVHAVGKDRLADVLTRKENERGVRVAEDETESYQIEVRVILDFGVELAAAGSEIQQTIHDHVTRMTSKRVARVDVIIDGIHFEETAIAAKG